MSINDIHSYIIGSTSSTHPD